MKHAMKSIAFRFTIELPSLLQSVMSMIEMNGWDATDSRIMSWFGRGVESITVLAFRSRASMTVRSFSSAPAFGIDSNGMVFRPWASFHQPALT